MSLQLKEQGLNGARYKYKADGVICVEEYQDLEILLTEVSNSFGSKDSGKISFDHYKAMFGLLAMLRTIAQKYRGGSFDTFKTLKVHFIHAKGTALRHWSMSIQAPGVYLMTKEQRVDVPVKFVAKDIELIPFIEFHKTVAVACENTIDTIIKLKKEHIVKTRSNDENEPEDTSLLCHVNPSIIRINEGKHTNVVADDGPQSAPNSPSHY
ncbi:hypothetical protein K501DRAFT_190942 [Backusella circina FSU 941]|nr:hypothetical protein K501DRAFT_190942 [Backusella circina FSU 941]